MSCGQAAGSGNDGRSIAVALTPLFATLSLWRNMASLGPRAPAGDAAAIGTQAALTGQQQLQQQQQQGMLFAKEAQGSFEKDPQLAVAGLSGDALIETMAKRIANLVGDSLRRDAAQAGGGGSSLEVDCGDPGPGGSALPGLPELRLETWYSECALELPTARPHHGGSSADAAGGGVYNAGDLSLERRMVASVLAEARCALLHEVTSAAEEAVRRELEQCQQQMAEEMAKVAARHVEQLGHAEDRVQQAIKKLDAQRLASERAATAAANAASSLQSAAVVATTAGGGSSGAAPAPQVDAPGGTPSDPQPPSLGRLAEWVSALDKNISSVRGIVREVKAESTSCSDSLRREVAKLQQEVSRRGGVRLSIHERLSHLESQSDPLQVAEVFHRLRRLEAETDCIRARVEECHSRTHEQGALVLEDAAVPTSAAFIPRARRSGGGPSQSPPRVSLRAGGPGPAVPVMLNSQGSNGGSGSLAPAGSSGGNGGSLTMSSSAPSIRPPASANRSASRSRPSLTGADSDNNSLTRSPPHPGALQRSGSSGLSGLSTNLGQALLTSGLAQAAGPNAAPTGSWRGFSSVSPPSPQVAFRPQLRMAGPPPVRQGNVARKASVTNGATSVPTAAPAR